MSNFDFFEALRVVLLPTRPAFLGEATGRPDVPYLVVNPDWEPEPDIGQPLLGTPSAYRVSIQINCYGRSNVDALWLDSASYTVLMGEDLTVPDINVLFRDADDSPVLSRTETGLILCKRWYRFVYS